MYKLNTHDMYGQSNEYCRRAGNFEFQFSGPESIPNAVKRYNKQRAAELAQMRKDREPAKPTMPRFCKVRRSGNDVLSMVTSRDLDVETQLSLESSTMLDEDDDDNDDDDDDVCEIVGQVLVEHEQKNGRLCGGAEGKGHTKARKSKSKSKSKGKSKKSITDKGDEACQQIEALHREVCAELQFMEESQPIKAAAGSSKQKNVSKRRPKREPKEITELRKTFLPKPEEVLARLKIALGAQQDLEDALCVQDVSSAAQCTLGAQGAEGDRVYPQSNSISFEDYPQQQAKWVDIMPSAMVWQAIQVNVCNAENATPMAAYQFMDQHGSAEPEPMTPFFLEDGDLEHEYAHRPSYMRYLEPRPTCPSSEQDQGESQLASFTDPTGTGGTASGDQRESGLPVVVRKPCFVELEQRPHRISLLRSLQPMRYTSQRSEETHVPTEEEDTKMEVNTADKENMTKRQKVRIEQAAKKEKSVEKAQQKKSAQSPAKPQKSSKLKADKTKAETPSASPSPPKVSSIRRRQSKSKTKATKTEDVAPEIKFRNPGGRDVAPAMNTAPSIPAPPSPNRMSMSPIVEKISPRRRRQQRSLGPLVCSMSLENLKFEKLTIYNKISLTQERIISSLDRLQNSLLQLHVPPCSPQERQRKERNAFEFCVRFARNFLYPLKGMIDDVRCTPVTSFNSAKSNEACQRVVCVYGLIQQSVHTFQRQLRYFLLDKVPQKLSALIEMIYTVTNVCLDKGIMDRQDPVVECLQQRCTKFLTFIEDMQEERFQLARETYRRLRKRGHKMNRPRYHHYHRTQSEVRSQRYDLKMCLNDLKFYEPRLVPRKDKRPRPLLRVRKMRGHGTASGATGTSAFIGGGGAGVMKIQSDTEIPPAIDQLVETQIENIHCSAMSLCPKPSFDRHQPQPQLPSSSRRSREKTASHQTEQELHEALFEALQHVSKNQVQQVLDPLMRSLGAMLQKQAQPSTD